MRAAVSMTALSLNTIFGASILLPLAVGKLVLPFDAVRKRVDPLLNAIATRWVANNAFLLRGVSWDVLGLEGLARDRWYLILANHQSWADIFVMQHLLNGRAPMIKFFLKQRLIWVPLIGLAWWALDFPFMRRHSAEYLRAHPEKRGEDLAAIRRACAKFSLIPTTVMTFAEGTRFTRAKHDAQESPYRHLLVPKAGGIALALDAMGARFHSLLDVTIVYPGGAPSFADLLAGRMTRVVVRVREVPIPADLLGCDYGSDPEHRGRIRAWLDRLWREKDATLQEAAEG